MDKIIFIVNPVAGGGKAKRLIPTIRKHMEGKKLAYSILETKEPGQGIELSQKAIEKGYTTIVAVGGDGTVNEVARGLIKVKKGKLGIIPGGTGNDMARSLGIPFDITKAIDMIINKRAKTIDLGFANGQPFINIASLGFDAEVVISASKIKSKFKSKFAYLIGVITTLIEFKMKEITLEFNGKKIKRNIYLTAVGNGKYYGGGFNILPMADLTDGYFHICIVSNISKLMLLLLLPSILVKKHIKFKKYVEIFKTKEVKVYTNQDTYLNIDGEIFHIEKETIFKLNDEKLNVIY